MNPCRTFQRSALPRMLAMPKKAALVAFIFVSLFAGAGGHAQPPEDRAAEDTSTPVVGATIKGLTLPAVETRPAPEPGAPAQAPAPKPSNDDYNGPMPPTKQTLVLIPGVNQVIPIARGHLNRIVTPFSEPVVHTTSTAKISTQGNVLYVASTVSGPTTLYVSPRGHQGTALSLTLLPRAIAPREIWIRMAEQAGMPFTSRAAAGDWERERPYVTTIKKVLRKLALGEIPSGYGLRKWRASDPFIGCAQAGIAVEQGQVLTGAQLIVLVGKVTNISGRRLEIIEARCRQENVIAVAAWPHANLAPGSMTELYVIMRRPDPAEKARQRPSLLGGDS